MKDNSVQIREIPAESTWPLRQAVMWPDKPIDYVKIDQDEQGLHYGLFVKGQLVSIVSAFVSGDSAQFRKFATLQTEQGKGYGSHLLSFLIEALKSMKIKKIWCNARINKAAYYERFGLEKTGRYFARGEIDYVIMEKKETQDSR